MNIETALKNFLHQHLEPSRELLLALSGGPDSLALFYALLRYREQTALKFHVAHIDHGWREESAGEAAQLKEMVTKEGISFHLRTLSPHLITGNLEDGCRQLRHQFFREVVDVCRCQAVMLGHHSNDQGETVLKRLFEGASLTAAAGMAEVTSVDGLMLWRPLLGVSRAAILQWIDELELSPFFDETNDDSLFLRGRMRNTLLPTLEEQFGKKITSSLCRIGKQAQELQEHLNLQIMPFLELLEEGVFGFCLDLSQQHPQGTIVWKYLIRTVAGRSGLCLSDPVVDTVVKLLQTGAANRRVHASGHTLQIDRRRLFVCKEITCDWKMEVEPWTDPLQHNDWKDVWRGECSVVLPEGDYWLEMPNNWERWQKTTLDRWWTQHKVPAFLRRVVPVVKNHLGVQHEFLSGRALKRGDGGLNGLSGLRVTLFFNAKTYFLTRRNAKTAKNTRREN